MTLAHKATAGEQRRSLPSLIERKGFLQLIEAHAGLSALLREMRRTERDAQIVERHHPMRSRGKETG